MIDKRFLVLVAPLALMACGDNDAVPTGQVVATVNGEEITSTDLDAELNGATAPTPEAQKNLQRMALEQIINRTLLAQEAVKEGFDKSPEYAVLERKAKQAALIEMLQRKMTKSVPKATNEEADAFVANNPTLFANRKVYVVDQIIVPRADRALVEALRPVKTLEQANAVLAQRGISGNPTVGVIDSLTVPPQAAQQIANMPADDVFIIPSGGGLRINHIRSSQTNPVVGDQARGIAKEILQRNRTEQSLQASVGEKLKAGRANVKYSEAFTPPPPPKNAPAAAPAAGAGTAAPQAAAVPQPAAN